jgi:hypothetical protein
MPMVAAALAAVLALPSLGGGLVGDDYHHKLIMKGPLQGPAGVIRLMDRPWDMFRFFDGRPGRVRDLIEYGAVPWWTYEHIRGGFWRPIASLTHWADYLLWPNYPSLMHAQSVLWYALAVGLTAALYRRLMGLSVAAGLAAVLYAVDHTHGMPVGFLANRSDLPSVVFGVLCLMVHDRWRRGTGSVRAGERERRSENDGQPDLSIAPSLHLSMFLPLLALALLALSLLSKEAGIATCAYLTAYEAFLVDDPWWKRIRALAGYALVVILWRACWTWLGYGVSEIGLYIDPLTQFGRYAAALPERMLVLLLGLWGLPPTELALFLGPRGRAMLAAWAAVFLVAMAWILLPLIRRDRVARFWAVGMLLAALPACATFMSGRLMMFAGIGAMGLMAQWLCGSRNAAWGRGNEPQASSPKPLASSGKRGSAFFSRAMAGVLVVVHLVLAPLILLVEVRWPAGPESLRARLCPTNPMDPGIREQDLVLVNPPAAFGIVEGLLVWASEDAPMPRHVRVLASGNFRPVEVYRTDTRTLIVRPEVGFMGGILDVLFRGPWRPFATGDEVTVPGMTVRITELNSDGRPAEAAFRFDVPLEDASLRWVCWQDGAFIPFVPPQVGERVRLASH